MIAAPLDRSVYLRRRLVAAGVAIGATALLWVLLFGGGHNSGPPTTIVSPAKLAPQTTDRLGGLSEDEKVDQLIMAADPGPDDGTLGAVLVDSGAWPGAGAGKALTKELRREHSGQVPAMIGTTQEGGAYRELPDLPPGARAIEVGDTGKPRAAEAWAGEMAKALHEEGFDFNVGPLADIATLDSAISDRAFSDDPAVVNAMVAGAFAGCAEHKIACIPAHFPGQGGTSEDTGSGPASVAIDARTLETRDIPAFAAAFEQGAPAVVISNAFFSAYDPVTPASLSPAVLDGVLRRGLGFGGVAISGDLLEGAIRSGYKVTEAAVDAIEAGADMVQISDPAYIEPVRNALRQAVASGAISSQRLDSAAGRVLEMKGRIGLAE